MLTIRQSGNPVTQPFFALCFVLLSAAVARAGGSNASITLQPVPPKTVPPSNYPPGTTIVGQEIILGSVPARVWLEVHITGWAPEILKAVQATISATDAEGDGGGYFGVNAECMGAPSLGAGDLAPALQPCNVNADCRPMMSGITSPCGVGEPSRCVFWDGVSPGNYFPAGRFCEYSFQDRCDPQWGAMGIAATAAVEIDSLNGRFGFAAEPGEVPPDFHPSYIGTLVLDVPANAKGTYTIDFDETQTFIQNPLAQNIPVTLFEAKITVPCGRCCSGYSNGQFDCVDRVAQADCAEGANQVFTDGELCLDSGGTKCPECATNANCDDGVSCTIDLCAAGNSCSNSPNNAVCDDGVFCNGAETCDISLGCRQGSAPCEPNQCDEQANDCTGGIPTVSNWGLVILALSLLIMAKFRSVAACRKSN